jgi:hypothetical protein|tara:strand:+ start:199 stop:1305 length:1107 start_codon:yes stop_codon:yes gene_type:complete
MSAYKQLNAQDLIISPFEVNKSFYFKGGLALTQSNVEINRFLGRNGDYLLSGSVMTGAIPAYTVPQVLVYDSIQQLYYKNYISGSGGFSQPAITASVALGANPEGDRLFGQVQNTNYYDYPSTSLWPSRGFPTPSPTTASVPIGVISIPSKLWGDYIQPDSFLLEGPTGSIKDDGEGRLLYKTTASNATYNYMAGNIIYEHGIVTIFDSHLSGAINGSGGDETDFYGNAIYGTSVYGGVISPFVDTEEFIDAWILNNNVTMSFSSSYTIYETQYKATVNENEFNYTLNPSSITGSQIPTVFPSGSINWENTASSGVRLNTITGSYFSPYITTVGLYDEDFQLLAIGKLAQPLQSSQTTDTTILVNIDR